MKNIILLFKILVIFSLTFFASCTVEKRQHLSGYHVVWNKHKKNETAITEKHVSLPVTNEAYANVEESKDELKKDSDELLASISPEIKMTKKQPISFVKTTTKDAECDEIVLKDGTIIKGKVEEVGIGEIKYKRCDNLEGPVVAIKKSTVFMIKYTNGSSDVINQVKEKDKKEAKGNFSNEISQYEPMSLIAITALCLIPIVPIFSLIGIVIGSFFWIPVLFIILAFISSLIALKNIRKDATGKLKGKALAKTALIISSIYIGFALATFIVLVLLLV